MTGSVLMSEALCHLTKEKIPECFHAFAPFKFALVLQAVNVWGREGERVTPRGV